MFLPLPTCLFVARRCFSKTAVTFKEAVKYYNMNTAYFRYEDGSPTFFVGLRYVNKEINLDKQFNFSRKIDESAGGFTSRVDASIENVVNKKIMRKAKKNATMEVELKKCSSKLLCNGVAVEAEFPCLNIFNIPGNYSLDIFGVQLQVEVNVPWVENLTLPRFIMAGFFVYPAKFESYCTDREQCHWTWSQSGWKGGPWVTLGTGEVYETSEADVGKFLKLTCEPRNEGKRGPSIEAITEEAIGAGPGPLPFSQRHKFTANRLGSDAFRVVSYNVLADMYVDSQFSRTVLFSYCPVHALQLAYRRQLLLKELLGYNADILCMQEVDSKVFRNDLVPLLKMQSLKGCYSQKGSTSSEGTAIFYNTEKFQLLSNSSLLLSDLLQNNPLFERLQSAANINASFTSRVTDRSTTLQVAVLESLEKANHTIVVANVHLYFHPDAAHVRLFQAIMIVTYLEDLLRREKEKTPEKTFSVLWCGDFNSVPKCGIYQLVTQGCIPSEHIDWKSNENETIEGISHTHNLKLASAYGIPQYTNYTVGFKGCLDYIFYDTNSFSVEQVVPLPTEEQLSEHLAIPSVVFPSDHIALVSDLRFKD